VFKEVEMGNRRGAKKRSVPQEQVFVNMVRVHERASYRANALLKAYGLSGPQYNVLRILRGAGEDGLPCQGIGERLITRVPDITRLLDRLENAGYVTRTRGEGDDRRVVITRIAASGLDVLSDIDEPMMDVHRKQFSNLTAAEVRELNGLLSKVLG
jgi:DNA-binding MarR family transcriptional regulator